jgi:hypothetical protein
MVRTRDLLIKIGRENALPIDKVEEIILKLEAEWYSDSENLKEINESAWKEMNIPARLVNLIKKYLVEDPLCVDSARAETLERLASSLSRSELSACLSTLQQIVYNLCTFSDVKYRNLKLFNPSFQQKVSRFPQALQYLKLIGFVQNSETLTIHSNDQNFFTSILTSLNQFALKLDLPTRDPPEKFDPFKSSILSTDFSRKKFSDDSNNYLKINQEIKEIKENREEVKNSSRIRREPKIFRPMNENFEEGNCEEVDDEIIRKDVQSFMMQREKSACFQNKRRNELEKLRGQGFCTRVGVKVKFPDGLVLQGSFAMKETVQDVYFFVRSFLVVDKDFYLFTTLPKRVLRNSEVALERFAPSALFYFAWADESRSEVYLKNAG